MSNYMNERDLHVTYSIEIVRKDDEPVKYFVTVIPDRLSSSIQKGLYRHDAIPEWMHTCMSLLDVAKPGHVQTIGRRLGDTYWIDAQE